MAPGDFPDEDDAWIDYYGGPETIKTVSYSDVVQGKQPGQFSDKIVSSGHGADRCRTSTPPRRAGDGEMAGAEIQATRSAPPCAGFPLRSRRAGSTSS